MVAAVFLGCKKWQTAHTKTHQNHIIIEFMSSIWQF